MEANDRIAVVGSEDTVTGFSLAGVAERVVADGDADAAVAGLMGRRDIGIMIIDEETMAGLGHKTKKLLADSAKPVVITVPSKKAAAQGEGSIQELVKRAIGIELK